MEWSFAMQLVLKSYLLSDMHDRDTSAQLAQKNYCLYLSLHQNFPRFTAWLGNYSSSNKQRRLLGELTNNLHASGHVHDGRAAVRLAYVPALRAVTTRPLANEAEADVAGVVSLMQVIEGGNQGGDKVD